MRFRHLRDLRWQDYAVCARTTPPDPAAAAHPIVVAASRASPWRDGPPAELVREFPRIATATLDVLRATSADAVYLFWLDVGNARTLGDAIVGWAAKRRPGLIAMVEDGGGAEREYLLDRGFDDAVTGRVSTREIVVRIRAVQRRVQWRARDGWLRYGPLSVDVPNHVLWTDGIQITLTPVELDVMRELIEARGRPLSRADLLAAVWDPDDEVTARAVDNIIMRLRRKLPRPETLETIRGVGFRLDVKAR